MTDERRVRQGGVSRAERNPPSQSFIRFSARNPCR